MAFEFEYVGGSAKPTSHTTEKFMLFFAVGGREVPMYQLQRDSLVQKVAAKGTTYLTALGIGKLFVSHSGFGQPKRYHSFYFRFMDGPSENVTILPFTSVDHGPNYSAFFFKGKIRFLTRQQVLELLSPEAESRHFVERQTPLALDVLHKMVRVERVALTDIRHIRIGKGKRSGNLSGLPMDSEKQ